MSLNRQAKISIITAVVAAIILIIVCNVIAIANNNGSKENFSNNMCAFSNFTVNISDGWSVRGNASQIIESPDYQNMFLLIGNTNGDKSKLNNSIFSDLENFMSSDFYSSRIKLNESNSEDCIIGKNYHATMSKGTMKNLRNNEEFRYVGYFFKKTGAYLYCFCSEVSSSNTVEGILHEIAESYLEVGE